MAYKLTQGWPQRLSDGAFVNPDTKPEYLAWLAEGNTPEPTDAKTKEQIIEEYQAAVQKRLDDFAQTRNYNGILSACTYAARVELRWTLWKR
jgi:hypothetical protein